MLTWENVYVPRDIVTSIKYLSGCYFLDALVHQLVYRNKRKPHHIYSCHKCGVRHKPERSSEEIPCCPNCTSRLLSVESQWRWGKEIPQYSRKTSHNLQNIIDAMRTNYTEFFNQPPTFLIDCGWHEGALYCQFEKGDKVYDAASPRVCILKAAILCPYLWDFNHEHIALLLNGIKEL